MHLTRFSLLRSLQFQLRFAPSLAQKPRPPKAEGAEGASEGGSQSAAATSARPPYDPFESPSPGLLVLSLVGSAHRLVLNKFAICRDHAILTTAAFRPQNHLLAADDLAAAYACVESYHAAAAGSAESEEELFVFYNSGVHSGASQPHRHLQMLPVARMREDVDVDVDGGCDDTWGVLADRLVGAAAAAEVPFYVAAAPVRPGGSPETVPSAEALHALYLRLYRQACVAAGLPAPDGLVEEQGLVPARLSYNLALTRTTMALCPRRAEGGVVVALDGTHAGTLSLNGTVLAGTALVKNEAEWTALRQDPSQLARILCQIGLPLESVSPKEFAS